MIGTIEVVGLLHSKFDFYTEVGRWELFSFGRGVTGKRSKELVESNGSDRGQTAR